MSSGLSDFVNGTRIRILLLLENGNFRYNGLQNFIYGKCPTLKDSTLVELKTTYEKGVDNSTKKNRKLYR